MQNREIFGRPNHPGSWRIPAAYSPVGTARGRNWRPVHIWDPFGAATQKPSATSHTCSQEHGHYEGMPDRTLFA
ncbi:hypothetical protein AALB47_24165 [Lachnospiraceae bacterium 54-11]